MTTCRAFDPIRIERPSHFWTGTDSRRSALPRLFLGCAVKMPIGAVEHRIGRGEPLRALGEIRSVGIDASRLELTLGRFLFGHRLELERSFFRDDDALRKRLARAEDVGAAFGGRLEDTEEQHRPPVAD